MKKLIATSIILIILFSGVCFVFKGRCAQQITPASSICTNVSYIHSPTENSTAMKDIMVDPSAIYGYSPCYTSSRLSNYSVYNYSNPVVVSFMREKREKYCENIANMEEILFSMIDEGKSAEEIARAVSAERNRMRLESYLDDPSGLAAVKESNLKTYGNEDGPTADYLYEKKGSWEAVIVSAFSSNPGMDACVGLYDEHYDLYVALGCK